MVRTTEEAREYNINYREKHLDELKLKRQSYRSQKPHIKRAEAIRYHKKLKLNALSYYSSNKEEPECAICKEKRLGCLSLDHINNDGNLDKDSKGRKNGGQNLYLRLKTEGYPEGFQVLCMNCQFIKAEEYREILRTFREYMRTKDKEGKHC